MLSHPEHVRSRGQKAQGTATSDEVGEAGVAVQNDCKHSRDGAEAPATTSTRQQIVQMTPVQGITSKVVGARLRRTGS
jgi:hypothetical protein